MATNQGDLFQLIDKQWVHGVEVLNIYYYRFILLTGSTNECETLATRWEAEILPAIRAIQSSQTYHLGISVRNLSNNIDFHDEIISAQGTVTATTEASSPSFVAVNFKLLRETLATRNGSKRISGLAETGVNANGFSFPSAGVKTALEVALAADVTLDTVARFEPVIVKRPIVPPVGTSYVYASIGAAVYTGLTTQNTRKS